MKVFVAGATGAIGQQLVPQLVERGHEVTAMTRSASKQQLVRELGGRPVVADALDAEAVVQVVARAEPEVIVHQLAVCVRRFVAQSDASIYARVGGPVKTEEDSVDASPPKHAHAGAATVNAIEGRGRGIYNVVDDEPASVAEWPPAAAAALGAPPPRRVRGWLVRWREGFATGLG